MQSARRGVGGGAAAAGGGGGQFNPHFVNRLPPPPRDEAPSPAENLGLISNAAAASSSSSSQSPSIFSSQALHDIPTIYHHINPFHHHQQQQTTTTQAEAAACQLLHFQDHTGFEPAVVPEKMQLHRAAVVAQQQLASKVNTASDLQLAAQRRLQVSEGFVERQQMVYAEQKQSAAVRGLGLASSVTLQQGAALTRYNGGGSGPIININVRNMPSAASAEEEGNIDLEEEVEEEKERVGGAGHLPIANVQQQSSSHNYNMDSSRETTWTLLEMKGEGGKRWPRQETLALLRIRSEMDTSFRDSGIKRPLWDEVSRKLSELGYHRSPKKCKEKFENVHKYYKRTKEGKAGRQDGKSYRFFDELEALYATNNNPKLSSAVSSSKSVLDRDVGGSGKRSSSPPAAADTLPLAGGHTVATRIDSTCRSSPPSASAATAADTTAAGSTSSKSSFSASSSSDDEDVDGANHAVRATARLSSRKRKRRTSVKMMAFMEKLLKKVMEKQEQMQHKFLEALERREQERIAMEEAWKRQEMARMNREQELRAQEKSLAASRDAAIVAFLHKVTGQAVVQLPGVAMPITAQPLQSAVAIVAGPSAAPTPLVNASCSGGAGAEDEDHDQQEQEQEQVVVVDPFDPSSKRWPKAEVLALIRLRTALHLRFTESGPKAPLWEDISSSMSELGYSRSAKRCKEKWENINKYFKKAKESNKNRPENGKTCPYYHELDALYKQGILGGAAIKLLLPSSSSSLATAAADQVHDVVRDNTAGVGGDHIIAVDSTSAIAAGGNSGLSPPPPEASSDAKQVGDSMNHPPADDDDAAAAPTVEVIAGSKDVVAAGSPPPSSSCQDRDCDVDECNLVEDSAVGGGGVGSGNN